MASSALATTQIGRLALFGHRGDGLRAGRGVLAHDDGLPALDQLLDDGARRLRLAGRILEAQYDLRTLDATRSVDLLGGHLERLLHDLAELRHLAGQRQRHHELEIGGEGAQGQGQSKQEDGQADHEGTFHAGLLRVRWSGTATIQPADAAATTGAKLGHTLSRLRTGCQLEIPAFQRDFAGRDGKKPERISTLRIIVRMWPFGDLLSPSQRSMPARARRSSRSAMRASVTASLA
jgi:hypothetical protein